VPVIESEQGLNHRIYYTTTSDFETFAETKIFFNPDFSVIDAAIVRCPDEEELLMVVKNENSLPAEKNLRITRTRRIEEGFPTTVSPSITGDYWCEGPAPLFVGKDLYIYFDKYRKLLREATRQYEERYGPITADGTDTARGWALVLEPWPWEVDAN
jgi:hypothetical protein